MGGGRATSYILAQRQVVDGRTTGALLPVGVSALKPSVVIKAQVPCGGSIMRVKTTDAGPDGIYPHEKMEVYAMGFATNLASPLARPATKWANALAVADNAARTIWATGASPMHRKNFLL